MKLAQHTENIRKIIDRALRNKLGRMGINPDKLVPPDQIPAEYRQERQRMEPVLETMIAETGDMPSGYEKLVEELTFTLFNRIAALKVMEAHLLIPEAIIQRERNAGRSFAHSMWLERHPQMREADNEGLLEFFTDLLKEHQNEFPLFSLEHPFHLLPTSIDLKHIIEAFNAVDKDDDIEQDIWKSDDILGWLYESYNNDKKEQLKASRQKTEYDKVSIQSQVYTPRWVVKFLVDNSLGKLYLEMFPDSSLKENYDIANAPREATREPKPLHEIKLIDPATGSGNFLLYAFDLLYEMYMDQIEKYGAFYDEDEIPALILQNNLYGIDLDDRAVQLAQLGLYIKAKQKNRQIKIDKFNVVSSDFFLPEYSEVKHLFENGQALEPKLEKIVVDLWEDLRKAYKFGSLIRLQEKFSMQLHGLVEEVEEIEGAQLKLFTEETLENYENFRKNFFHNLQKAVENNRIKEGQNFLNTKTADAIRFLQLLTQQYDVAVANPPYTDSSDFGPELKKFINDNYKKPYKFNTNLYAAFIKRNYELTHDNGYIGMIHPHTFMFIKTFEDVRKFIIEKTHIDLMVDYGLDRVNLFGPGILLDATWYVLSKAKKELPGVYFQITGNQQEKTKKSSLEKAYDDLLHNRPNSRIYFLTQEKLKIIDGWPVIYWISDTFREKFKGEKVRDHFTVQRGCETNNNIKYLRFWWEFFQKFEFLEELYLYAKGGPYNKWYGNLWLTIKLNNKNVKEIEKYGNLNGFDYYGTKGITYTGSGSKGPSFRYIEDAAFDVGGSSIFSGKYSNLFYGLGFFNSKLTYYIINCLNPTVNIQIIDIKRIPFVQPDKTQEEQIALLAKENVAIKKHLYTYSLIEMNFEQSPLQAFAGHSLTERLSAYLNYENYELTKVLIHEAIIDEQVFQVYELEPADREQVEQKMGKSIGALPVLPEALALFQEKINKEQPATAQQVLAHLQQLETATFAPEDIRAVKEDMATLYQSNNNLEEFSKRHRLNPINVWYWFQQAKIIPQARAKEVALEFLADALRHILMEDEDGIIPLVNLPGEKALIHRLEQYVIDNGMSTAQFMQLEQLLGRPVDEYLKNHFFKDLSDRLNLFMYLPKTPFIWHLTGGKHQGIELYVIIYKWSRDSLYRIKSKYVHDRKSSLEYRLMQLAEVHTAQALNEKERIRHQLDEIQNFVQKIDELIAENYDPELDDGVGKNIAPLQAKGLLKAEVLKTSGRNSQLQKYLNADW